MSPPVLTPCASLLMTCVVRALPKPARSSKFRFRLKGRKPIKHAIITLFPARCPHPSTARNRDLNVRGPLVSVFMHPVFHCIPPAGLALKGLQHDQSQRIRASSVCDLLPGCLFGAERTSARPGRAEPLRAGRCPDNSCRQPGSAFTKADIDRMRKVLSNWGRWGADDELGAVNLITPAKRIEAARLVKEGIAVSLAHNESTELAPDNNHPLDHKMLRTGATPGEIFASDQYSEVFHGLGMTHLDAVAHMMDGDQLYNGFSRNTVTDSGAEKASVIALKGGISRGESCSTFRVSKASPTSISRKGSFRQILTGGPRKPASLWNRATLS